MQIRSLNIDDAKGLHEVEIASGAPKPWSETLYADEFKIASSCLYGAYNGSELIGLLIYHKVIDEFEVMNIAVRKESQGQGVASVLFQRMFDDFKGHKARVIFLEVREHNVPAQALYKKFGFKQYAIRKHYYEDSGEDAILMKYLDPQLSATENVIKSGV